MKRDVDEMVERLDRELERQRWTREGVMLERRRRREWERDFMTLVVVVIAGLLLVVTVVGAVRWVVESWGSWVSWGSGGSRGVERRYLVENWGAGRYGDELELD